MAKASKKRACPAAGSEISAAECGEGRNSRYSCPADCPHNPFAVSNYDQLLRIEDSLDYKTNQWVAAEDPERHVKLGDRIREAKRNSAHAMQAIMVSHLFFQRDAAGLTCAQRWERAGFPGLSNDERCLFRCKMQMRVVLIEIRQLVDHERMEIVDLLAEGSPPVTLVDRSLAKTAVRFGVLLGWGFPQPHYWRTSGSAVGMVDMGPFGAAEIVNEIARHLGAPEATPERQRWFAENFLRVEAAITATSTERWRRMYAALDATSVQATYELLASYAECRRVLDQQPEVEPEDVGPLARKEKSQEARTWFDDRPEARVDAIKEGRPILGTVLLRAGTWKLIALSREKFNRLQPLFEQRLGSRVRLVSERRDDVGPQVAGNLPETKDSALIPPRLLEENDPLLFSNSRIELPKGVSPEHLSQYLRESQWKTFADDPIPALDGRTPREAAKSLLLRPRLLELMKRHVRTVDQDNLRTGSSADINPLLRELGLHELDVPPPPPRARQAEPMDADDEFDEDEDLFDEADMLAEAAGPELPPLPTNRPLTVEEADFRLGSSMDAFETAADALDAMAAAGSTLIDDLFYVTGGLLDENEFNYLIPLVIPIWFALVPRGERAPHLPRETLRRALDRDLEWVDSLKDTGSGPDEEIQHRRQPHLTLCVMGHCFEGLSRMPKKTRLKPETQAVIGLVLGTVVEELDRAVRE